MQTRVSVTNGTQGAGSATGNTQTEVKLTGYLEFIEFVYDPSAPATTVITITEVDIDGVNRTIYTAPAGNTNGVVYPRAAAVNQSGAAITNSFPLIYLPGYPLKVTVTLGNNSNVNKVIMGVSNAYLEP